LLLVNDNNDVLNNYKRHLANLYRHKALTTVSALLVLTFPVTTALIIDTKPI